LILRKILKIIATRRHILRLKYDKFSAGLGPSLQSSLDGPLAGFGGPTSKSRGKVEEGTEGKRAEGREERKGKEGKWRGGKERGRRLTMHQDRCTWMIFNYYVRIF